MTTAARSTWVSAKGGNQHGGGARIFGPSRRYCSRNIASHTTSKPRTVGQDTQYELQKRNLRDELEEHEKIHFSSRDGRKGARSLHLLLEGAKRDTEIFPRPDDDDDTEALLAEIERIRTEKAEEKLRKARQQQEEDFKVKKAELVKRRWEDDVVFKMPTRGDIKATKRFVNDTIRNDFHRKFLQKFT